MDCTILNAESMKICNSLTAVVSYKIKYIKPDGTYMILDFGLRESISVNAIIGLPTLKELMVFIDMNSGTATSNILRQNFDIAFQHTAS